MLRFKRVENQAICRHSLSSYWLWLIFMNFGCCQPNRVPNRVSRCKNICVLLGGYDLSCLAILVNAATTSVSSNSNLTCSPVEEGLKYSIAYFL